MNDRKQHVIKMAHQLFIEKGFQATSIQDILDYSGISKGTFYNYFSSKNELLIALFKMIYKKLERERNDLLIGRDPSDIEIFIKQVELQLKTNRANKLLSLYEEVIFSNDEDLKQFMKRANLLYLRWVYERFSDILDKSKKPYLLDCAIMFTGILHANLKYNSMAFDSGAKLSKIVRYSVARALTIAEEVSRTGEQLLQPGLLDTWLPDCRKSNFQRVLNASVLSVKKALHNTEGHDKYIELLDFIQEELLHSKAPRKFLIESALLAWKTDKAFSDSKEWRQFEKVIDDYFIQAEQNV